MAELSPITESQDEASLNFALERAEGLLLRSYLSKLDSSEIISQFGEADNSAIIDDFNKHVRFYEVTQIVFNKKENVRDKLVTVFNSVRTVNSSLLMQIQGSAEKVAIRFGVKNADTKKILLSQEILEKNFRANFPGSILKNCDKSSLQKNVLDVISSGSIVSSVTDVAGLRFDDETKERLFMQGVEKLIDTLQGESYSLLLIADPISLDDLNASRRSLEDLYSSLVPFSESQFSMGTNESKSVNHSITTSVTHSVNKSVTDTVSHTIGKSTSVTDGTNSGRSINGSFAGAAAGAAIGSVVPGLGTAAGAFIGGMIGGSFSINKGENHSKTTSENESDTTSKAETSGTSDSLGQSNSDGITNSNGTSQNLQIKFENHTVKKMLERIDETLKRYDTCADLGMWNCAVYCISDSEHVSQMAAGVYHSLIRGKNSSLENGAVTVWSKDQSRLLVNSLKHMTHPLLNVGGLLVTPGTLVSSKELAIGAGFPNHSVPGIPVIECAEFGRTVSRYEVSGNERFIALGKIFNMHAEEKLFVNLNIDSLSSHAFVTGSTGSGKSNTIYQILIKLRERGVNFLVVEPAKGEYKAVFGKNAGVSVYGTNPEIAPLLRINPFSFPCGNETPEKNVHVLEHIDRLVEIFNVCWPMYAAMPAVLKDAIEKSYEDCGWNLVESTNEYGKNLYPTFADIVRNIKVIIEGSEYDAENKGAYKGSLITRLKSLTNGINGLVFTADEIANCDLFDENVIVDLSRVGSSETQSLIMGLLVLKLQEYRMTSNMMNAGLRHVTVLEEAHNLLKKTNASQSQESGNLLGKSVEMLANSIAEMRTYGEGFVIADQAPALLDMSVIRNTNTKIIMRLPDKDDRELVGKAANLNEDQIIELAKLPCGVAAVYQNEWVEPVLCKVQYCAVGKQCYSYKREIKFLKKDFNEERIQIVKILCNGDAADENKLKEIMEKLQLNSCSKVAILKMVKQKLTPRYTKIAPLIAEIFPSVRKAFVMSYAQTNDTEQWTIDVDEAILELKNDIDEGLRRSIRQCIITDYLYNELGKVELLEHWAKTGGVK